MRSPRNLAETQLTKKPKTLAAYTTALDYFLESCKRQQLADVERRDLLEFAAFLRDEKEQAPRSVYNKFENVMTFLKANGIRGLVGKNDWPRFTEEEPEMYEPEELAQLFAACNAEERLWYEFFLMTGESNTAAAMMAADCGVYPNSWPSGAWGSGHGPIGGTPPVNSNPWSPFNPWPPMQ